MQSKLYSLYEAKVNAIVGICLAWVLNVYLAPVLFDIHMSAMQGTGLTAMFTVLSIIRQYVIRRIFNRLSQ